MMSNVSSVEKKFCTECGNEMNGKAEICPACGVRAMVAPSKGINKVALLLITFFLGGFGGHRFYQKKYGLGILYLLFCWTYIPMLVSLVEFIIYCFKSEEELNQRYPETSGKALVLAIVLPFFGIVVVSILAAIAIPQFDAYRLKAYNDAAKSDLKNCTTNAEAYSADNGSYPVRADQLNCSVTHNGSVYYLALGSDKYQIISYHEKADKAYLRSSDATEIAQYTKTEIISQISSNLGSEVVGNGFHFIK